MASCSENRCDECGKVPFRCTCPEAERPRDPRPIKLNARGRPLADRIYAGLAKAGVEFRFEPLPNNDFRFHVAREDESKLRDAASRARVAKAVKE